MIAYSEVTRERLEEYYRNNFINKDNLKKISKEKILSFAYWVMAVFIYYLFLRAMSEYVSTILAFFVFSIVMLELAFFYVKLISKIHDKLFPMLLRIDVYYENILEFQELLKTKNIEKISTDGCSAITLEYRDTNTITKTKTIKLIKGDYFKTVKEDYIDFRWIDEEKEIARLKRRR